MTKKIKIFISYAREDYESARRLYMELLSEDLEPWLDREKLLPGQRWEQVIDSAIRESQYFIVLLSSNALEKRGYIQKEIKKGLDILQEIPDSQVFLIPARLDDCQPTHPQLRELQWVDLFPEWNVGLKRIIAVFEFAEESLVPSPSAKQSVPIPLEGTAWQGADSDKDKLKFWFEKDGVLKYENPAGTHGVGIWTQNGNQVYIELNNKYAQYSGEIDEGTIRGHTQNVAGRKWTWVVHGV